MSGFLFFWSRVVFFCGEFINGAFEFRIAELLGQFLNLAFKAGVDRAETESLNGLFEIRIVEATRFIGACWPKSHIVNKAGFRSSVLAISLGEGVRFTAVVPRACSSAAFHRPATQA